MPLLGVPGFGGGGGKAPQPLRPAPSPAPPKRFTVGMSSSFDPHTSVRSSRRYIAEEVMVEQHDSLCLLPSSMRCLCALLTLLLIMSLGAAIFNSLQVASTGSKSYCKPHDKPFHRDFLCPKESMFIYYQCCNDGDRPICCSHFKFWLLTALVCVACSFIVGVSYTLLKILLNFRRKKRGGLLGP